MTTILIVDDDELIRAALGEELVEEGFVVVYAATADAAVEKVSSQFIDLMLLDLKMPGKDGFFVLRKLRELELPVKVIILSAYADVKSAVEAAQLGACEFFHKPFDFRDVISTIKRLSSAEFAS